MSLLTPIGLLGLIGVAVLILIYIIKPNYQNKFISSTYIWKLSLKYKKKRIPISKLRNILIFICQVAILVSCAFILAQPFIDNSLVVENGDTIMIIDTSPSMHTKVDTNTRLGRAARKALSDAEDAFKNGNKVTIIAASDDSYFVARQIEETNSEIIYETLSNMASKPSDYFSYCTPDIDGAMELAEQITAYTDRASVTLYTDTEYHNKGDVQVYKVGDVSEWNAAILDVRAKLVENHYMIEVDVASYGKDSAVSLELEILEANGSAPNSEPLRLTGDAYCINNETTTYVFGYKHKNMTAEEAGRIDAALELYSYGQIYIKASVSDSLDYDNQFYLYGGKKPDLKILYSSSLPNPFFPTALLVLQDALRSDWNVIIDETVKGQQIVQGYDVYIYEHEIPKTLPDDGLVICMNPKSMPTSSGLKLGGIASSNNEVYMDKTDTIHPIMKNIDAAKIAVTQFTIVSNYGDFEPLMTISDRKGTYPTLLVKEEIDSKMIVIPFSLHYSNLAILPEFPLILKNAINHFFPTTVDSNVYETGDEIELNARGDSLEVSGAGLKMTIEEFPHTITVNKPGTVTLLQYVMSSDAVEESVYVKIADTESNILLEEETLKNPYFYTDSETMNIDLLFYFALAMVAFLFLEWWLKSREQI